MMTSPLLAVAAGGNLRDRGGGIAIDVSAIDIPPRMLIREDRAGEARQRDYDREKQNSRTRLLMTLPPDRSSDIRHAKKTFNRAV
jgi:hypothetical protein